MAKALTPEENKKMLIESITALLEKVEKCDVVKDCSFKMDQGVGRKPTRYGEVEFEPDGNFYLEMKIHLFTPNDEGEARDE